MSSTIDPQSSPSDDAGWLRRLSRPSVKNLLILIVVLGVSFGAVREMRARRVRFRARAWHHQWVVGGFGTHSVAGTPPGWTRPILSQQQFLYHADMYDKYDFAAEHPWLPVLPDPPFEERD